MKYNTKRRKIERLKWCIVLGLFLVSMLGIRIHQNMVETEIVLASEVQLVIYRTKSPEIVEMSVKQHVWQLLTEEGGLSFDEAMAGMAIVDCESRWDIYAIGPTNDYGIWQIHEPTHQIGKACSFDVYCSTRYAIELYKSWGGWEAWVCS